MGKTQRLVEKMKEENPLEDMLKAAKMIHVMGRANKIDVTVMTAAALAYVQAACHGANVSLEAFNKLMDSIKTAYQRIDYDEKELSK